MAKYEIILSGYGGQGLLIAGQALCYAALTHKMKATWVPSYGSEMRGGTAYCMVVLSEKEIDSPVVNKPDILLAFNLLSLQKFGPKVKPSGCVIVNRPSMEWNIRQYVSHKDTKVFELPLNDLAAKLGDIRMANMVCLGAFIEITKLLPNDCLVEGIGRCFLGKKESIIQMNKLAIQKGMDFIKQNSLAQF